MLTSTETRYTLFDILSGALSCIGRSLCRALSRQGAHLVLGCRDRAAGEELAKELAPSRVTVVTCDLSSLNLAQAAAAEFKVGGFHVKSR